MKQDKSKLKQVGSLRKQAEKTLAAKSGKIRKKPAADMEKVAHELQVHQIELEMQNDELRKAQIEIEESRTKYFELYDLAPVGYFTLNPKGIIEEVNLSGTKLLNIPKSALIRKPFFLFVLPESRIAFYAHLKKVFDTGAKQTCELELMSKKGSFPVLLESIAINGKDSDCSQCFLMVRDVTEQKQAEEESIRFASFPKLNPNPVLEVDSSGKITFHNEAAAAVLKKFNLSEDISVFLPGDIKEILTALKQKKEGQYYRELIMKGKVFEETIYLAPQFNSLRIYAVDITERKQAETALQVSESKYRSLFANMISGFAYHQIVLNRNGKPVDYVFLEINDAFEKLTGLKRENIIGKRATEIVLGIENDPADWIGTYGNVALTGKETTFENHSDALKKWFSVSAYSPQKGYFVAVFDDITERKQMEGKLRRAKDDLEIRVQERTLELKKSEYKYRILIEQAADGIVLLDRKLNLVDVNTTACRMTGFTREELLKLNAVDLYPQGELEERPLRLDQVLAGETVITESRATKKDGSLIEVEISAKLIEGGEIQAIVRNITERKVEEKRTHLITELLELFAKKTARKDYLDSVVQFLHNWTGCRSVGIRVVNKERSMPYDSYRGFSEEFMRKENMISLDSDACACIRVINGKFEPQDAPAVTPNGSFRLEDSSQFANQLTEKELSRFRGNCIRSGYASIAVIPIRYHNKPLGAIHLADEKKNMVPLDAVQFLESMAAPLIGEAICRFSAEEELTQHRNHLEEIVKERTRELHDSQEDLNRAQTVAHTGSWRLDVRKNELLWSDENWRIFGVSKGTALTYETFLSTIHPDDREHVDKQWSAALQGEPYDIEHRILVDGQVKWVREKTELEFDEDNNLKGGFGTTQDITEMKQAEKGLQTLMEELKRSNSDLEQFAYAASHDLQEPLRVVAGFVSLLEKKYKEKLDDKAHEYIEYSIEGVKRMQVLIKDLLAYSQVGAKGKTFKPTICSVALEQAIYNLHTAIEESGAEITYDSLPTVSADTSQLIRLFQNLIGNAIKFRSEERLKIQITAERKGNEWVFSIRDNGIGIDPKFFDRIFVVFQRLHTREEYEGTGIGLAVCKKIAERHGGHIWVESEQGKGTSFYFTMPVME